MEGERSHQSQEILKLNLENCIRFQDLGIILYSLWLYPLGSRLSALSHSSFSHKRQQVFTADGFISLFPASSIWKGGCGGAQLWPSFIWDVPFGPSWWCLCLYKVLKNLESLLYMSL